VRSPTPGEGAARRYESELSAGRVLVTVRAGGRADEAADVLRRHGARDDSNPPVDLSPIPVV